MMRVRVELFLTITCLPILFLSDGPPTPDWPDRREREFCHDTRKGKWGLAVTGAGMASVVQPESIAFEFFEAPGKNRSTI
jgi:hypothetical protein